MKIKNTLKITNAAGEYYVAEVAGFICLFTDAEIEKAKERAMKNPEDILNLDLSCEYESRDEFAENILLKLIEKSGSVINQDALSKEASSLAAKFRAVNKKNNGGN